MFQPDGHREVMPSSDAVISRNAAMRLPAFHLLFAAEQFRSVLVQSLNSLGPGGPHVPLALAAELSDLQNLQSILATQR